MKKALFFSLFFTVNLFCMSDQLYRKTISSDLARNVIEAMNCCGDTIELSGVVVHLPWYNTLSVDDQEKFKQECKWHKRCVFLRNQEASEIKKDALQWPGWAENRFKSYNWVVPELGKSVKECLSELVEKVNKEIERRNSLIPGR